MDISQLKEIRSLTDLDAVFITKEKLREAAEPQYAKVYKTAGVPFFFIESLKSYIPFTYEELSYDEVPDSLSNMYATGYYQYVDEMKFLGIWVIQRSINEIEY